MIDGQQILGATYAGQVHPTWRIFQAQKSFFFKNLGLGIFLLVISIGGTIYMLSDPLLAFGPRSIVNFGSFEMWRTIDFIILGIVFLAGLWLVYSNATPLLNQKPQLLVLLPEGVVMGKGGNTPEVISFAIISEITPKKEKDGDFVLQMQNTQTGQGENVTIDGRYGKSQDIVEQIVGAYHYYRNSYAVPQHPQQGMVPPNAQQWQQPAPQHPQQGMTPPNAQQWQQPAPQHPQQGMMPPNAQQWQQPAPQHPQQGMMPPNAQQWQQSATQYPQQGYNPQQPPQR